VVDSKFLDLFADLYTLDICRQGEDRGREGMGCEAPEADLLRFVTQLQPAYF
jgi:hypothetical protein